MLLVCFLLLLICLLVCFLLWMIFFYDGFDCLCRYEFELDISSLESSALGSVSVRLTFANVRCISEHATVSLLLPQPVPRQMNNPNKLKAGCLTGLSHIERKVLCGPVRLKPLIDVTEQSLQVLFSHPQLLSSQTRVLLVSVNDLFSSEYKLVSYYEDSVPAAGDAASRRQAWRNKAFRHQVQVTHMDTKKAAFPVKVCTCMYVYILPSLEVEMSCRKEVLWSML